MSKSILGIGGAILILNILVGLVLSAYSCFNCAVTTGVIIANTFILALLGEADIKDGFKISFGFLFTVAFIIEFFSGLFCPESFENNGSIILIGFLLASEAVLFIIAKAVS